MCTGYFIFDLDLFLTFWEAAKLRLFSAENEIPVFDGAHFVTATSTQTIHSRILLLVSTFSLDSVDVHRVFYF